MKIPLNKKKSTVGTRHRLFKFLPAPFRLSKLKREFFFYLIANICVAFTGFIAIPALTRIFSPDEYGEYKLLLISVTLLTGISVEWLNSVAIRFFEFYRIRGESQQFISTLFVLTLIGSLSSIMLLWVITSVIGKSILHCSEYFIHVAIVLLFIPFIRLMLTFLLAERRAREYTIFQISYNVSRYLVGIFFTVLIVQNIGGMFIGWAIAAGIFLLILQHRVLQGRFGIHCLFNHFSASDAVAFLKFGLPLISYQVAAWILAVSDRYMLQLMRGTYEVGLYSVGYAIAEKPILLLTSAIFSASNPAIMQTWERDGREATQALIRKITKYYLIIVTPVVVLLGVFSKQVVNILLDTQYESAYTVILPVSIGIFLQGLANYANRGIELSRKTHYIIYIALCSGIVNIMINLLTIPRYGFLGAAISTLIAYLSYLILSIIFGSKLLPWK